MQKYTYKSLIDYDVFHTHGMVDLNNFIISLKGIRWDFKVNWVALQVCKQYNGNCSSEKYFPAKSEIISHELNTGTGRQNKIL